ncbi:sulfatase family protein [Pirellulaceae bacterium SH501]
MSPVPLRCSSRARSLLPVALMVCVAVLLNRTQSADAKPPNIVLIFADDLGYGDLGCFGSKTIRTPNLDRLAEQGRKFTNFMVASPVCTPSRAALLTGCYPKRVSMHQHVLFPTSTKGLNPLEHTIADHLKGNGYATACFGKWHLGHHPEVLPTAQGFDTYFGIPYSNDMNHPDNKAKPQGGANGMDALWKDPESTLTKWNTPLFENEKIIELPVDQRTVTRRYTEKAIDFVKANREKPFFIYLPHSMPHIPLYVPDDVRDPDPKRAYINTIEHIDTEIGRLLQALDDTGVAPNTFVIFTSDNGPWLPFKHHGGSAGPLRDGKGTTFEGGQRVPCLIRGPGIPAGTVCDQLTGTIDVLPTLAAIIGSPLPSDRKIDGMDVSRLWLGTDTQSPRDEFVYYTAQGEVEGIRQGNWKLLVKKPATPNQQQAKQNPTSDKKTAEPQVLLFDLANDLGEQSNQAKTNPDIIKKLRARLVEIDTEITQNARAPWVKP